MNKFMRSFALATFVLCVLPTTPLELQYNQNNTPGIFLEYHSDTLFSLENAAFFLTTSAFLLAIKYITAKPKALDKNN